MVESARHGESMQQAWLAAAQAGDSQAFGHLVRCHQAGIRAVLRRLCHGDAARADELAQESFLQAWLALPGFRREAAFRTWLFRLSYHCFLQDQRRPGRHLQRASVSLDDESSIGEIPDATTASGVSRDWSLDLQRALDGLPGGERDAIIHVEWAGLTHAEAAEVLGRPLGTLKTQVLRGRERLRQALAAWAPPATSRSDAP